MKPDDLNGSGGKAFAGCLLGTAVGDSIGLPAEGMRRGRAQRFFREGVRHRLLFGRGMCSDDTEHSLMVAEALRRHPDDIADFQKSLGRAFRWWLLSLPAGVGLSTAKAILRLWIGIPATRSGVCSAGNGAAMRSAVIGVRFCDKETKRRDFSRAACRITHTDPRAEESALLVSEAAALATTGAGDQRVIDVLRGLVTSEEMKFRWLKLEAGIHAGTDVGQYAREIGSGRGVSGFAPDTVAVALYSWLRHRGDFRAIITGVVRCGGDTDSVAAIAGAIGGVDAGEAGIPEEWLEGICDWPRSVDYIRKVSSTLIRSDPRQRGPGLWWPAVPARNLLFLMVVLCHGFRRLFPPY